MVIIELLFANLVSTLSTDLNLCSVVYVQQKISAWNLTSHRTALGYVPQTNRGQFSVFAADFRLRDI